MQARRLTAGSIAALCAAALLTPGAETARKPVSLARLAGQTIVTVFRGTSPSADFLGRVTRGEVGGVILFGTNITTRAELTHLIATLQAAAAGGGNPPLLVAIDQEGGAVKRLSSCPPDVSAETLGRAGAEAAEEVGRETGVCLHQLGITVDLAPVLDVGDPGSSFLGSRLFGSDTATVAAAGVGFADGLDARDVAATAKHFPGLGTAGRTTDTGAVTIDATRSALLGRLGPFRRAIQDGVPLVMVSTASYPSLDPSGSPAVFSRPIIDGLLRGSYGFDRVVVTDDLAVPGLAGWSQPAARAIRAGVDLLLFTVDARAGTAYGELVEQARHDRALRKRLVAAAARIARLKQWLRDRS